MATAPTTCTCGRLTERLSPITAGWTVTARTDGRRSSTPASRKILNPGVYVVEVAAQWHHWNRRGFELQYAGAYAHTGDDTKLSDLEISDVNLANFRAYTTDYARNVAADVDTVTVTPTRASSHSEVTIIPADANGIISGHQVSLEDGETEIMLTVASNVVSDLETVYRIRLTKLAGTTSPLSADAALSDLSFDNIDIGTFASGDTEYPYALDFYGALNGLVTTMTPTTANSGATWKSNRPDADPNADGHQISVNGDDTLAITVTSQDGANPSHLHHDAHERSAPRLLQRCRRRRLRLRAVVRRRAISHHQFG